MTGTSIPDWQRRYRAARVSLPSWAEHRPDRAVYASNASGVWQVFSWDLPAGRHTRLTDKVTGVAGGRAAPDGSAVVWFDDAAGDEVGRYVATPFEGGATRPLVPEAGRGWSEGVSWREGRIAVGMSDRDGFRIGVLDEDGYRGVLDTRVPVSVGGLSKDGLLLAVSSAERGDVLHPAVRVFDARTGEPLAELWDGPGNGVSPAGWSPVKGDGRLAVLTDRGGRTLPEMWTPTTGAREPLTSGLDGEVWVADWAPDGRSLLLASDHRGHVTLHRYDLGTGATQPVATPSGTVRGARIRDDGAIWYAFSSAGRAPQVRVRDLDGDDRVLLAAEGDPAPDGVAYRSLDYDNGDGGRVHAFVAAPPGAGPFPLVVDVHGGPHAHVSDSFDPETQAWVDHGFAVLQPNYRGSTGYDKAWEEALVGDPGRPELVDARAGAEHLVAEGVADPGRMVLSGASWGGYLVLQGLGTQPGTWSAGVAIVPVADYPTAFADESPVLQELDRVLFGGTPDDVPELYRERSPLTHVEAVRAPVLVITGANDTRCPKRQVDNYVAALVAAGKPHHYDVFDAGHGSLDVSELIRQRILALDFVAQRLGTRPAQRVPDQVDAERENGAGGALSRT